MPCVRVYVCLCVAMLLLRFIVAFILYFYLFIYFSRVPYIGPNVHVLVRVCLWVLVCVFCPHIFHFDTHISRTEPKLISDRQFVGIFFHTLAILNIFAHSIYINFFRNCSNYLKPVGMKMCCCCCCFCFSKIGFSYVI